MDKNKLLAGMAFVVFFLVICAALLTLPVYFLWNWLMPVLFGLPKVTLLQAAGVTFLSSILFSRPSGDRK